MSNDSGAEVAGDYSVDYILDFEEDDIPVSISGKLNQLLKVGFAKSEELSDEDASIHSVYSEDEKSDGAPSIEIESSLKSLGKDGESPRESSGAPPQGKKSPKSQSQKKKQQVQKLELVSNLNNVKSTRKSDTFFTTSSKKEEETDPDKEDSSNSHLYSELEKSSRPRSKSAVQVQASQSSTSTHYLRPTTSSKLKVRPTATKTKNTFPKYKPTIIFRMGDTAAIEKPTLKDQFTAFSRFGDTASDGKQITLTNSDKWLKQAQVIDGKKITTTDTSICFKKLFKTAKKVNLEDYNKYLENLATSKKMEVKDLTDKMINCGTPSVTSSVAAAAAKNASVVDRLTDTSKYTGSHKERFDSTGKGRGIDGRRDKPGSTGYTAAFTKKLSAEKKDEVATKASK